MNVENQININKELQDNLFYHVTNIISETNGISLNDTLELLVNWLESDKKYELQKIVKDFIEKLNKFQVSDMDIHILLDHPMSKVFFRFFKNFPLSFHEEHIHLSGSLDSDFIFSKLQFLLDGPNKKEYETRIKNVYGKENYPIKSAQELENILKLKKDERFARYLKILFLPKLILIDKNAHKEAAFHMAKTLYYKYNVGRLRLKFTLVRSSSEESEQIIGTGNLTPEDVILGLYEGFMEFKNTHPNFKFILAPCFRKEVTFFDSSRYKTKEEHFLVQVNSICRILEKYPFLEDYLCEVDTVGDERELYRKEQFNEMKIGFRKLQARGFRIRSHHGETWNTLKKGIQAVDNAMNIWHIDTLEHGLSLGINPNYYFHSIFQRMANWNKQGIPIIANTPEFNEISEMIWEDNGKVLEKLIKGIPLNREDLTIFLKTKFHTAKEVEHYQHDILNRMINKNVSLVALPSSNTKLTSLFADFRDHPFSWWEKKGLILGVGTDNYVTLQTNFIQEMLILLYTDPQNLKITKLLMVTTGENRRPYISYLLWQMRKTLFVTKKK